MRKRKYLLSDWDISLRFLAALFRLALREKSGVRQPYRPGIMVGLGDSLESSTESKFFTPPFQTSNRCGAKVWPLCSTLREKNSSYEEGKKLFPAYSLDQILSTLFFET